MSYSRETVMDFILNGKIKASESTVTFDGFEVRGDAGNGLKFYKNGQTGEASKTPSERGGNSFTDSEGYAYTLTEGSVVSYDGVNDWFSGGFGSTGVGIYILNSTGWVFYADATPSSSDFDTLQEAIDSVTASLNPELITNDDHSPMDPITDKSNAVLIGNGTIDGYNYDSNFYRRRVIDQLAGTGIAAVYGEHFKRQNYKFNMVPTTVKNGDESYTLYPNGKLEMTGKVTFADGVTTGRGAVFSSGNGVWAFPYASATEINAVNVHATDGNVWTSGTAPSLTSVTGKAWCYISYAVPVDLMMSAEGRWK